ncbi:MAG: DUF2835 family protein [Pseudomonadota bacterium]
MPSYQFDIDLSSDEVHTIYTGQTRFIVVQASNGLRLQLPSANFRDFVTHEGLRGRFTVTVDASNRIQSLRKL